jgi:phosphoribosylformimino-5-aminoimidazole carboxamide ribotide isomerase
VADAEALAAAGVARVVMGSAAVQHPERVDAVADVVAVAVGLDHRGGEVAVHGWTEGSSLRLADALHAYPRASAFVITDIERDGTLEGPDVAGLAAAAAATDVPVIASGGVSSLEDLRALAAIAQLGGIITGTAIYESRFTVAQALGELHRA